MQYKIIVDIIMIVNLPDDRRTEEENHEILRSVSMVNCLTRTHWISGWFR